MVKKISMLDKLVSKYGLDKVNSLTKYPSILTYHEIYQGSVLETLTNNEQFPSDAILEMTEKVDGINSRMIYLDGDFILGERKKIVFAKDDRINNSSIISPMLYELSNFIQNGFDDKNEEKSMLTVIYGESYGYNIASKKQYVINSNKRKYRVFDVIQMPIEEVHKILAMDISQIALWRDHMNQPFLDTAKLGDFCKNFAVDRTPIIKEIKGSEIPVDCRETFAWMQSFSKSQSVLDIPTEDVIPNQKYARAEGVILRTKDRSMIRKLRFEDYQKGERIGWKVPIKK